MFFFLIFKFLKNIYQDEINDNRKTKINNLNILNVDSKLFLISFQNKIQSLPDQKFLQLTLNTNTNRDQ